VASVLGGSELGAEFVDEGLGREEDMQVAAEDDQNWYARE
jgi:hypothetical protein